MNPALKHIAFVHEVRPMCSWPPVSLLDPPRAAKPCAESIKIAFGALHSFGKSYTINSVIILPFSVFSFLVIFKWLSLFILSHAL